MSDDRSSNNSKYDSNRKYNEVQYSDRPSYTHSECTDKPRNNFKTNRHYMPYGYHSPRTMQYNYLDYKDYGKNPIAFNINKVTKNNTNFRTAFWTGTYFQLTLMSIGVGEDIGLEMHSYIDQFLRIEEGKGIIMMGKSENNLDLRVEVADDYAIIVPAGTWHNLINTGNIPLKVYSIYAPIQHPFGTIHETKEAAMEAEHHNH